MSNMSKQSYLMEEMSWPEVETALEEVEAAIIPVGSHEQHGPHLAESCDSDRAEKFARLLAERLYPRVLVTPTVNFGVSYHHMKFPGTITLSPETFISLLFDIARSLHQHGLERIIIFNAHGGNDAPIDVAIEKIRQAFPVRLTAFKHSDFIEDFIDSKVESETYGHACEYEVSEMLYLAPEKVKKDKLTPGEVLDFAGEYLKSPARIGADFAELTANGALGDATLASRELGEEIITEALDEVVKYIEKFINI